MNIKRNCYDKKLSPLALFFLTAFNWLWFRTYLWGCRNKFCYRYCFTAHLPRVKAMGAQYWRERGVGWNYSFRPNYRSTPFHIMSTQWGAGSISRGRERWSFHNILFRSVLFPNDFTARQSLFFMGQGWNLALYYISLLSDQARVEWIMFVVHCWAIIPIQTYISFSLLYHCCKAMMIVITQRMAMMMALTVAKAVLYQIPACPPW